MKPKTTARWIWMAASIAAALICTGCQQQPLEPEKIPSSSAAISSSSLPSDSSSSGEDSSVVSSSEDTASSSTPSSSVSSGSGEDLLIDPPAGTTEQQQSWWKSFLDSAPADSPGCDIFLYDNRRRISVSCNGDFFAREEGHNTLDLLRDSAEEFSETALGEKLDFPSFFEIVQGSGNKYTGELYEYGISLKVAEPGEEAGEPVFLSIDLQDYETLLTRMEQQLSDFSHQNAYSSWLTLMRQSKCRSISGDLSSGMQLVLDEQSRERYNIFWYVQHTIAVLPESVRSVSPDTELENAKTIWIDFINDVQYRIQTDGESLLVASSDMTFALLYTLDTENYTLENIFDADGWNYNENPITG